MANNQGTGEFMKLHRLVDESKSCFEEFFYFHYAKLDGIQHFLNLQDSNNEPVTFGTEIHVDGFSEPIKVIEEPYAVICEWKRAKKCQKLEEKLLETELLISINEQSVMTGS